MISNIIKYNWPRGHLLLNKSNRTTFAPCESGLLLSSGELVWRQPSEEEVRPHGGPRLVSAARVFRTENSSYGKCEHKCVNCEIKYLLELK